MPIVGVMLRQRVRGRLYFVRHIILVVIYVNEVYTTTIFENKIDTFF